MDPLSIELKNDKLEATLYKKLELNELVKLPFEFSLLKGDNVRLKIDEDRSKVRIKGLNTKRYDETAQAIFDGPEEDKYVLLKEKVDIGKDSITIVYGADKQFKAVLDLNSVVLTIYYQDHPQVSFNSKQLLNFEHFRSEEENVQNVHSELELTFDMFHDSFADSKDDSLRLGPESACSGIP